MNFTVQKKNVHEISKFVMLAHELGVDKVLFRRIHIPKGDKSSMISENFEKFSVVDTHGEPIPEFSEALRLVDRSDPIVNWHELKPFMKS